MSNPLQRCAAVDDDAVACAAAAEPDAPVNLCSRHLLQAYDWVAKDVGVTDVLPSPCLACGSRLGVRYPSGWLCAICEWKVGMIPDEPPPRVRLDVVYYIRFGDRVKIGTTANPRSRLSHIVHDELLAFERGNRELEQRRHHQFSAHRMLRTEWFDLHSEIRTHVDTLRAGQDDPWSQYALWVSELLALRG